MRNRRDLRGQDGGNQFRVVVLGRIDAFADGRRDHVGVGILIDRGERFFRRRAEPGIAVFFG